MKTPTFVSYTGIINAAWEPELPSYTYPLILLTKTCSLTDPSGLINHQNGGLSMYSYGLLEPGCYYLVQEELTSPVELIKVTVESDHCMFVHKYADELLTQWKRKNDKLHDIIECLSDEMVEVWEKHYNNNEESYYEEDDE